MVPDVYKRQSHEAAHAAAIFFSLMGCCRENKVNPKLWMQDVPIKDTRGIIDAILDGSIDKAPTKVIPYFDFVVPTELPGVDPKIDVYKRQGLDRTLRKHE